MLHSIQELNDRCQAMDAVAEVRALEILSRCHVRQDFDRTPRATVITHTTYRDGVCVDIRCAGELWQ